MTCCKTAKKIHPYERREKKAVGDKHWIAAREGEERTSERVERLIETSTEQL